VTGLFTCRVRKVSGPSIEPSIGKLALISGWPVVREQCSNPRSQHGRTDGLIRELVEAWVSLFVPQDRRGSSLMTRVAGTTQATAALRISNRLTLAMVTGSFGVTPNVRARTRPPTVIDNTRPQPNPSNAGTKPYFSMNGTSSACLAPSASRTPSSRLRCSTVNRKNRI
jgi:hypothetical protein